MSANINPKPVIVTGANSNESLDAKSRIKSSLTSELVIALCGPIGSPLRKVAASIKQHLIDDFGYEKCDIIRLSEIIERHKSEDHEEVITEKPSSSPAYKRIKSLIKQGGDLRRKHGPSVLAELAVSDIVLERQKFKSASNSESYSPRRICHIIDSIKNQEELEILQLVYRDMVYFFGVYAPMPARVKSLEKNGMTLAEIYELIDQDSGEELAHGQTVRDTFPNADFFLRIDSDTDTQISSRVQRFLHLILGTKLITPTPSETAMYLAASAAGNSGCLSRQVGAAITDPLGEIVSVGWNDVPKFGGNLYVSDPQNDPNSDKDRRCWNLEGGTCFNDEEKKFISDFLIDDLIKSEIIAGDKKEIAVLAVIKNSKLKNLIEFSRSIHAEMHAILTGNQTNKQRVAGGKIFITTYPCHSCARHIVAAGITEIYYIEPYRKSLATKLHSDAITEDETDTSKVRLLPYDGVAPTRYLKLFRIPRDSRKESGKMIKVDPKKSTPRFDKTLEALPTLEALVVKGLREKQLIAAENHNV